MIKRLSWAELKSLDFHASITFNSAVVVPATNYTNIVVPSVITYHAYCEFDASVSFFNDNL